MAKFLKGIAIALMLYLVGGLVLWIVHTFIDSNFKGSFPWSISVALFFVSLVIYRLMTRLMLLIRNVERYENLGEMLTHVLLIGGLIAFVFSI